MSCNATSLACYTPAVAPATCADGTLNNTCSPAKPQFCMNNALYNNCTKCGCASGSCNATSLSCYIPVTTCSDGTSYGSCSTFKPKFCSNGTLIDDCSTCGCSAGLCNATTKACYTLLGTVNLKDMSKYSSKAAFMVMDSDWKTVLPLIPVTTWTGTESCQRGYGTPSNVCIYPTIIYHTEWNDSVRRYLADVDSAIPLLQDLSPSHVTLVANSTQKVDDLLVAAAPTGAGLSASSLSRITKDDYLSYWSTITSVVFVQNDYETALMATTYASLIDAPLIIQGTSYDTLSTYTGRKVICVGTSTPSGAACSESYSISQLRAKYQSIANTDKLIITNPKDMATYVNVTVMRLTFRTNDKIWKYFAYTSMASPILAASRQELLVTVNSADMNSIKQTVSDSVNTYMPSIVNNPSGVPNIFNSSLSVYGYLTMFGSPMVMQHKVVNYTNMFYGNISMAADQKYYADIRNNDLVPDMSAGRIEGFSLTDVTSYMGRELFYDRVPQSSKVQFIAQSFQEMLEQAENYSKLFNKAGYDSSCVVVNVTNDTNFACDVITNEFAAPYYGIPYPYWDGKNLVFYMDHGNYYMAGIQGPEMPQLGGLLFSEACSTCEFNIQGMDSGFCDWAIRKGTTGNLGTVSTAFADTGFPQNALNGVYYRGLNLGQAFATSYRRGNLNEDYMFTLTGDPLFDPNPAHMLSEPVVIWYSSKR